MAIPTILFISDEQWGNWHLDYTRFLRVYPHEAAVRRVGSVEALGVLLSEGTLSAIFDWALMEKAGAIVLATTHDGTPMLPREAEPVLTERALRDWQEGINRLTADERLRTEMRQNLDGARTRREAVLTGETTPEPEAEAAPAGPAPDIAWPVAILPDHTVVSSTDERARRATSTIQNEDTVIASLEEAAALLTSFMKPDGILGFRFNDGQRVVSVRAWTEQTPAADDANFYMLLPESDSEATPNETLNIAGRRLPCYNTASLVLYDDLELRPLPNIQNVMGFRSVVDGILLPFGYQTNWTYEYSTRLLTDVWPALKRAHAQLFPRWIEGSADAPLLALAQQSVGQRGEQLQIMERDAQARAEDLATKLRLEQEKVKHCQTQREALQGMHSGLWAATQCEILESMEPISNILVDELGTLLAIRTKPITVRTAAYEFLLGRYEIQLGVTDKSSFGSEFHLPINIVNLDRGQNTYQHPHCGSGGSWCWGNAGSLVKEAWSTGDVAGAVSILLSFLQHCNWNDEYARHLQHFPWRRLPSRGEPRADFKRDEAFPGNIRDECGRMARAEAEHTGEDVDEEMFEGREDEEEEEE